MQTNKVPLKLEAWFSRRSPNINISQAFLTPRTPRTSGSSLKIKPLTNPGPQKDETSNQVHS